MYSKQPRDTILTTNHKLITLVNGSRVELCTNHTPTPIDLNFTNNTRNVWRRKYDIVLFTNEQWAIKIHV